VTSWESLTSDDIFSSYVNTGAISIDKLAAGGSFRIDFDLEAVSAMVSNDTFAMLIDGGYMTKEEADKAAEYFRKQAGKSYA